MSGLSWDRRADRDAGRTAPDEVTYVPSEARRGAGQPRSGRSLEGLRGSSLADKFRAWTGRSGRRYVCSVFPIGRHLEGLDAVPMEGGAVVIVTARRADGARAALWVTAMTAPPAGIVEAEAIRTAAWQGDCELHLYLVASDERERAAAVADLTFD